MKTVKEVSEITGVSISTLRYYDEIGLLNSTELTEAGYRLYDNKALEKLQEIMFFRELEISLMDIKKIMENPNYDKEQAFADLLKWYGSKEKVIESVMQATGSIEEIKQEQEENTKIYKQFMAAKEADNMDMAYSAVEMLAENYKIMFALDNARNILLDLAKEYLQGEKLAEATDIRFGQGCSEYVAHAVQHYYGA